MAYPVADSYTVGAGLPIYGGRFVFPKMYGDIVVAGDSITDLGYTSGLYRGELTHARSPYRLIYNAGITNNTLDDLWARWTTDVISKNPKIVWLRIGTNSVSADVNGFIVKYQRFTDSCQSNNMFLVVCAVPPRSGSPTNIVATNAALKVLCGSYPNGMVRFLDDCSPLALDANYNYDPAMFLDGIHPNPTGQYRVGVAAAIAAADLFLPNDPRITSVSDSYYLTPDSDQYVKNPFMTGTGGTTYYVTGPIPTSWEVGCTGGGTTGIASLLAADAGDANQTPWLVCELATIASSGHSFSISTTLNHPALAADLTVKRFDAVCEVRLINLDSSKVETLSLDVSRSGVVAGTRETLGLGGGILNDTFIMRSSYPRDHKGTTVVAFPANTLAFGIGLSTIAVSGSSAGKFAVRLASVRGQAT